MVTDMPMKTKIIHKSFKKRQKHVKRCLTLLMIFKMHTGIKRFFMYQTGKDMTDKIPRWQKHRKTLQLELVQRFWRAVWHL